MSKDIFVKSSGKKGLGVFTVRSFKKGALVIRGKKVKKVSERTDYSFQTDLNTHVQLNKPARLINHSCNPNLGVKNNSFGGYDFIALRKIAPGEELTWDYAMTEFISISVGNSCMCKTSICRNSIGGFLCLPFELRRKYGNFIADYLKRL